MYKPILIVLLFGLFPKVVKAQFFCFDDPGIFSYSSIKLSDWDELNINEAESYFRLNGLEYTNTRSVGSQVCVRGKVKNASCLTFVELIFEKGIISGYTTSVHFMLPCLQDMTRNLDKNIFQKQISDAVAHDRQVLESFISGYNSSMRSSGDKLSRFDTNPFNVSIENYFYDNHYLIYREGRLEHSRLSFEAVLKQTTFITKENYLIAGVDLKEFNTSDIRGMVDVFLRDAKFNGITTGTYEVSITFSTLQDGVLGVAMGMNNDRVINVLIDRDNWFIASPATRWYVLYHELGHDVLNLEHFTGGRMMNPISDSGYSWSEFWNDRQDMFNWVLINGR